ncbi:DUF397 domain-containing protein [Streptomyces colonosanans]|uniref:DUF397 domain-containing protein n=1 Tax=Streptomyces colonosanans TaxID=1428652 RepID=A0A1S2Q1T1_9ACTN|nr:DUF397 domain-containing protein [Streptomyces colonosanans]OIJ99762.1 DUF397 domain-containing protein [Streptomyces colonosanans]
MSGTALEWFKSSYSGDEGGQCLEVAYNWRKSSYSGSEGGQCVEVSTHPTAIHLRDSKNPAAPHVTVAPAAWAAFLESAGGVACGVG